MVFKMSRLGTMLVLLLAQVVITSPLAQVRVPLTLSADPGKFLSGQAINAPGAATANYMEIGNAYWWPGDGHDEGNPWFYRADHHYRKQSCGSSPLGTLKSGSNDMVGEATVGTATVSNSAVSVCQYSQ